MSRARVVLGSLVGAAAIHVAFVACGPVLPAIDASIFNDGGVMDTMRDALLDAIGTMRDAEVREAQAQDSGSGGRVLSAACDRVTLQTYPSGGATSETRYFFAEFSGTNVDGQSAPRISGTICGGVRTRVAGQTACVAPRCTGYDPPEISCSTALPYFVGTDRIVVFCGAEIRSIGGDAGVFVSFADHGERAFLRIE